MEERKAAPERSRPCSSRVLLIREGWFLFSKPLLTQIGVVVVVVVGRLFIGFPFPAEGRVEEKGEGEDSLRALSALCSEGSARLEHRTGKIP